MTEAARIRELMLENLFSVFGERAPERRSEAIARNYTDDVTWTDPDVALVRAGQIAVLRTLLTGQD